jgi:hypothetical protein
MSALEHYSGAGGESWQGTAQRPWIGDTSEGNGAQNRGGT